MSGGYWVSKCFGYEEITKDEFVRRWYMQHGNYPPSIHCSQEYIDKIWREAPHPKEWYYTWMACYDTPDFIKEGSIYLSALR